MTSNPPEVIQHSIGEFIMQEGKATFTQYKYLLKSTSESNLSVSSQKNSSEVFTNDQEKDEQSDSQVKPMDGENQEEKKKTYKNPTKNILKNFLKAYISWLLSQDLQPSKKIARFFEGIDEKFVNRYVDHIRNLQKEVKDKDNVSFQYMNKLLLNEEFGRTTIILFDRFRRKNLDKRMIYSKIERKNEHFMYKYVIKKILKDPGGVNSFK